MSLANIPPNLNEQLGVLKSMEENMKDEKEKVRVACFHAYKKNLCSMVFSKGEVPQEHHVLLLEPLST